MDCALSWHPALPAVLSHHRTIPQRAELPLPKVASWAASHKQHAHPHIRHTAPGFFHLRMSRKRGDWGCRTYEDSYVLCPIPSLVVCVSICMCSCFHDSMTRCHHRKCHSLERFVPLSGTMSERPMRVSTREQCLLSRMLQPGSPPAEKTHVALDDDKGQAGSSLTGLDKGRKAGWPSR
jgi:hypothetical protein